MSSPGLTGRSSKAKRCDKPFRSPGCGLLSQSPNSRVGGPCMEVVWQPQNTAGLIENDLSLFSNRREQVAPAADGADHRRLRRVRLDLAPDPHDPQVHGSIESFTVACVGEFQQPFTREDALRIG